MEVSALAKSYGGLRPLRLRELAVRRGEVVAVSGLDAAAAQTLANLILGAILPDSGEVKVGGRSTRLLADAREWLAFSEQVGLVSCRVVLLEGFTVAQNLAVPFTLDLDAVPDEAAALSRRLADEVGLSEGETNARLSATSPLVHLKVQLARSLAFNPELVVLEHPTALLAGHPSETLASALRQAVRTRQSAALALTNDGVFARLAADRTFSLRPNTGRLVLVSR
ncbi:MAG: ATP-binding cassette domain-containing protein [Vicinamibacterales bacterium]